MASPARPAAGALDAGRNLDGASDQIVVAAADDFGGQELARAELGRIALGQIDDRIDIRRLTLEAGPQDEFVVARRAVDEQPNLLSNPASRGGSPRSSSATA